MFPTWGMRIRAGLVTVGVRIDGILTPIYVARDTYWIAGKMNCPYAIVVENKNYGWLEVLESVDGKNVLKNEPADVRRNRGMVVHSRSEWVNHGWRINNSQTNDFVFSNLWDGVAFQTTGTTRNEGVIGVAVYSEYEPSHLESFERGEPQSLGFGSERGTKGVTMRGADMSTGMGQSREDRVGSTSFVRASDEPEVKLAIQYRSMRWLEENGIVRPDYGEGEGPSAFPGSDTGYGSVKKIR